MIPKIMNVEALEGYKIKINYETGEINIAAPRIFSEAGEQPFER
jgi:hypothetical protein